MPLHLLGKKSWNVYNSENIARVRRDEEAAAAAEEAADQRMQEVDTARRMAVLRGETPPPLSDEEKSLSVTGTGRTDAAETNRTWDQEQRRKRRKIRGEDDTDRDIRLARQDTDAGSKARATLKPVEDESLTLTDANGHIQLFAEPQQRQSSSTSGARERSKTKEDDSMGMRFSHAAGYKTAKGDPWYAARGQIMADSTSAIGRDAFGNEDEGRKDRAQKRNVSSDPMAAMRAAQRTLKQSGRDKADWEEKQRAKIKQLEEDERRSRHRDRRDRRHRKPDRSSGDEFEGFVLDAPSRSDDSRRHRHDRHVRPRRDRSRSRSPHRHGISR